MLDWRNPEDYAYLTDYSLHEWAWEFLRRCADYRSDYAQWQAALAEFRSVPREYNDPIDRALGIYASIFLADATQRWGLSPSQLIEPELTAREAGINFQSQAGVEILLDWKAPDPKDGDQWPGYPFYLALQFDFRFDISTQLEIARERLERFSKHLLDAGIVSPAPTPVARKFRVRRFPLYVRLLDAELSGSSIGETGRVLFADRADPRKHTKEVRETARLIASKGYRELLLLPPYLHEGGI